MLLDLRNPRLKTLAKGLSGGTFRVGGTHGDSVIYGVQAAGGGACPPRPNRCYPICLGAERWKAIVGFDRVGSGGEIIFVGTPSPLYFVRDSLYKTLPRGCEIDFTTVG